MTVITMRAAKSAPLHVDVETLSDDARNQALDIIKAAEALKAACLPYDQHTEPALPAEAYEALSEALLVFAAATKRLKPLL